MSDPKVVIELAGVGRAVVHGDSLPQWEARGWVPLGPAADGGTTETSAEQAARVAAEAERLAAVLAGTPNEPKPRKRAAASE